MNNMTFKFILYLRRIKIDVQSTSINCVRSKKGIKLQFQYISLGRSYGFNFNDYADNGIKVYFR